MPGPAGMQSGFRQDSQGAHLPKEQGWKRPVSILLVTTMGWFTQQNVTECQMGPGPELL